MALEISIYNMQPRVSAAGKEYSARVCVFTPGQSGRLFGADQLPPFYIRDQRGAKQWVRLDARTIVQAKAEALDAQNILKARASGVAVAETARDEVTLKNKVEEYLAEVEANKKRRSWLAYKNTLENFFLESCHRRYVKDVTRADLIAFKNFLKKKEGVSPRSVYNHFLNTMIFFKWCGHRMGIKSGEGGDWPDKNERIPEAYQDAELAALLKAANVEERLLLSSFLCSGLREGELAHLTYNDIDFEHSIWNVRPKNGWTTKTKASQRPVAVPEWLTAKISKRMKETKGTAEDYVFSQKSNARKPSGHLLKIIKRVAERAKLKGRFDLHKFRSTYITRNLRDAKNPAIDVATWVGHGNTKTLARYYQAADLQKPETHKRATATFDSFKGMGD